MTLQGGDEVVIHTLAAAAYGVLRGLKKNKKGKEELNDVFAHALFAQAEEIISGIKSNAKKNFQIRRILRNCWLTLYK